MLPFLFILYREFGILFLRNMMAKKGISMGARLGGKIKTVTYISAGALALAVFSLQRLFTLFINSGRTLLHEKLYTVFSLSASAVFWLAMVLSLLSFVDYALVYRKSRNGSAE
jgi:CDP-diacylglycerol--glycerol-3-phosphate 3-phosphatidyltransferase